MSPLMPFVTVKSAMRSSCCVAALAGALLCQTTVSSAADAAMSNPAAAASKHALRSRPSGMPESARQFYSMTYGVDQLWAKVAESGQLVRLNYRVVDAAKAAPLNDRASTPYMFDEKVHAVLQVPTMEKVGPLRQAMPPEVGKSYWIVFSNKGNLVQMGHRVSVVIGQFRVDGLIVQ
jgi:hypothetical protein